MWMPDGSWQFSADSQSQPKSIGLLGLRVGGHPELSLHSSNERDELSQLLVMMIALKHCPGYYCYYYYYPLTLDHCRSYPLYRVHQKSRSTLKRYISLLIWSRKKASVGILPRESSLMKLIFCFYTLCMKIKEFPYAYIMLLHAVHEN